MSEGRPAVNDRLYRSRRERVVAGVCGGLADRFDLDPSIVRVAWVLLGIVTAIVPLFVLYLLMAIVVPEEPPGIVESMPVSQPEGTAAAPAWKAAPDAEWAARRPARRTERARRDGNDPTLAIVIGIGLIAIGGAFLARQWVSIDWDLLWPIGLILVGIVAIGAALRR